MEFENPEEPKYDEEEKELTQANNRMPKFSPHSGKIKILDVKQRDFVYDKSKGPVKEYVIEVIDGAITKRWIVTRGTSFRGVYAQLTFLGKKYGSLKGRELTLVVEFKSGDMKVIQIVEAQDLVAQKEKELLEIKAKGG